MKNFDNILYVADMSVDQRAAIERAVSLAENNQARLTLIDVVPLDPSRGQRLANKFDSKKIQASIQNSRLKALQSLLGDYQDSVHILMEVTFGRTFIEAIRTVLRNGHDLVIKPAESPKWTACLFGSEDMHLLRKCPCPVWLTKPGEKSNYENIVAAIDFDASDSESVTQTINQNILELASSLSLSDFAALHLVHAWDAPEAGFIELWADNPDIASSSLIEGEAERHSSGMEILRQSLHEILGQETYEYLKPRFHMPQGNPKIMIPELARQVQADLVVMGTVGRAGVSGLFIGNTAESILEQLDCSVLAIKPPGFETPVKLKE